MGLLAEPVNGAFTGVSAITGDAGQSRDDGSVEKGRVLFAGAAKSAGQTRLAALAWVSPGFLFGLLGSVM